MRVSTAALMAMLSLATTAVASQSAGQTPPGASPADADADQAVRHYEDGVRAAKLARWPSAYASFLAAWKLKRHYQIAANLGRAELQLTRYRDAAEHLAYFLREASGVAPDERKAAQAMLDEARAKVGSLTIIVDRAGAEVLVDGVAVGRAPLGHEVFVAPGSRTVEAKLSGFDADRRALNVAAGSTPKVLLTPTPRAESQAEGPDRPIVPQRGGSTPNDPDEPPNGGGSADTAIVAAGIATTTVAAGVGVVSLAIAITRGNEAQAIAAECAPGPPYCQLRQDEYDALVDDEAMLKNLAFWTFIGAGAAGAGTLVYALVRPSSESNTGLTTTVALGPGGGGLSIKKVW
jgi:PEGA domain